MLGSSGSASMCRVIGSGTATVSPVFHSRSTVT